MDGGKWFLCPCFKCGDVSKINSVEILREHIFQGEFGHRYHVWVWHNEEGVYEENTFPVNVQDEDAPHMVENSNDYETDKEDVNEDVKHIDEMKYGLRISYANNIVFLTC